MGLQIAHDSAPPPGCLPAPHLLEKFRSRDRVCLAANSRNWVIGKYAVDDLRQESNGTNEKSIVLH